MTKDVEVNRCVSLNEMFDVSRCVRERVPPIGAHETLGSSQSSSEGDEVGSPWGKEPPRPVLRRRPPKDVSLNASFRRYPSGSNRRSLREQCFAEGADAKRTRGTP